MFFEYVTTLSHEYNLDVNLLNFKLLSITFTWHYLSLVKKYYLLSIIYLANYL